MSEVKISPSIIAGDLADIKSVLKKLEESKADYVHIDVMDSHFVPNLTIGPLVIKSMRKHTKMVFDVHLMMTDPDKYLLDYIQAGADILLVHAEIKKDVKEILKKIRNLGCRSGIVYNPDTDISSIEDFFPFIDQILLMSVFPGFSGQKFIPTVLERGRQVKQKILKSSLPIDLEIDGGVGISNAKEVIQAGFNILVSGSAVFAAPDMREYINLMKNPV